MSVVKANKWFNLDEVQMTPYVQAVTVQKTDTFYSNSTSWIDVTGLSLTITPTYATSRIMLYIFLHFSSAGHGGMRLLRNGTAIAIGDYQQSNINRATFWQYGTTSYNTVGYDADNKSMVWVDSPNTTSAVTYKFQYIIPQGGYVGVNYNAYTDPDSNWNYTVPSSITAFEVQ